MGVSIAVFSQQKSRSTLNMYNITSFNPAAVGSTTYGDALVSFREQYLGFETEDNHSISPSTIWAGVHMPLRKINSGVGLMVTEDIIGFEQVTSIDLSYALQLKLGEGKLGIGVSLGFAIYTFDFDGVIYPNGYNNGTGSDTWLTSTYGNSNGLTNFLLGGGIFYRSKDVYLGISTTEINEPNFTFNNSEESEYVSRTYWINAGYNYQTSNPMWVFKPSALLKTNLDFTESISSVAQLSIELLLQYNKFIVGGVSYTSGNNISPILGVEINNGSKLDGLRVLVGYDFTWSSLASESVGSFEAMIGYSFNLSIEKVTKSYKSVRFL